MRTINYYLLALLSILMIVFQSCDEKEELSSFDNVTSLDKPSDHQADSLFTVSFVNPDGSLYAPDDQTKVIWTGSKTSYPFRTPVSTSWGTFCSKSGDIVTFSGGEDGPNKKFTSAGTYNITDPQLGITKDYTITVAKQYTVTGKSGTGGTITLTPSSGIGSPSSSVTAKATPNSGYKFSKFVTSTGWEITESSKVLYPGASYTITAYFEAAQTQTYTITIKTKSTGIEVEKKATVSLSVSGHNSMNPNADQIVASSASVKTWTITANKGATVTVTASCDNYACGFDNSGSRTKTFSNLSSNQSATICINY